MKISTIINAGLTVSLLLILSGPAQACELSNTDNQQLSSTESLSPSIIAYIRNNINEE